MCIGLANGVPKEMMPQEALDRLDKKVIGDLELKIVLSKALEKQIPKKSKILEERYTRNFIFGCPNCNEFVKFNQKYCVHCGQALDWSEAE